MMNTLENLANKLAQTNQFFTNLVRHQVNSALSMRNWLIGHYIVEYEQSGSDRALYGGQILVRLAKTLKQQELLGLGETNLKVFRQFYLTYPNIGQTVSDKLKASGATLQIRRTLSDKFGEGETHSGITGEVLFSRLSFSHISELLKASSSSQRMFYESETLKNSWSVRELQRAMNSMLFERTGLSTIPPTQQRFIGAEKPEETFRDAYVLEFLGLIEKPQYSESDLEQAIIDNLQEFLIEMGKGFCFEARQKRITFGNTHYRIDLVFYHRILKCHVLIDLKLGEFTHADSGQMNVYLNYFRENEMSEGDQPPIGIILCAGRDETLVKYATAGLSHQVFVTKYLISLPSEKTLTELIQRRQAER